MNKNNPDHRFIKSTIKYLTQNKLRVHQKIYSYQVSNLILLKYKTKHKLVKKF